MWAEEADGWRWATPKRRMKLNAHFTAVVASTGSVEVPCVGTISTIVSRDLHRVMATNRPEGVACVASILFEIEADKVKTMTITIQ